MKNLAFLLTVALGTGVASSAHADGGPLGLGLELGAPTGLSMKYYMGRSRGGKVIALQAGLGVIERVGDDGLNIHVEGLWHPAPLATTPDFTLPFYFGIGGRILFNDDDYCYREGNRDICVRDDDDTRVGLRLPAGLLMDFNRVPLDLFLELALVIDFLELDDDDYDDDYDDDDLVNLNVSIGGRYYF